MSLNTIVISISCFAILISVIGIVAYLLNDYKLHKKPLKQEDPNVEYTFGHHIKKVTIPLTKYRITVTLEFANSRNIDKF